MTNLQENDFKNKSEEKIKRSYFLCAQKIDQYVAKTKMEQKRLKKTKDDTGVMERKDPIDFSISYIPYIIVSGHHEMKYLRKGLITFSVEPDVIAIEIGDTTIDITKSRSKNEREVQLGINEIILHESEAELYFDTYGEPIKSKDLPEYLPLNEEVVNKLKSNNQIIDPQINERLLIDKLRSALIKRPQDYIQTIIEKVIIDIKFVLRAKFVGIFDINKKSKKMTIDSVTGDSKIE